MEEKTPKKRWRRLRSIDLHPVNRRAKKMEQASLRHAHRFVVKRFSNLRLIRRHIIGWLVLVGLLIGVTGLGLGFSAGSVTTEQPVAGGTYAEGMVDSITTLNPLFASTQAELSANKLIFSGLLKYDAQGRLQPDLAESVDIQAKGTKYVVTLKPHVKWHDGKDVNAQDVAATVKAIQDPKVGALAQQSWKDIKVEAVGSRQVIFTLPGAYAPFSSALMFAVLPVHIISTIPPEDLRDSQFSKAPVGSGPFRFQVLKTIDVTSGKSALQLAANENYWDGAPRLTQFSMYTYSRPSDLIKGLRSHEINAGSDVAFGDASTLEKKDFHFTQALLNSGVYALFRTDIEPLKDVRVRQALVQSIDIDAFRRQLEVQPLDSPVVNNQLPMASHVKQSGFDRSAAQKLFTEAGWILNKKTAYLEKANAPLALRLVTVNTPDYKRVVDNLAQQWKEAGIKLEVQIVDPEQVQQSILRPRAYDILVYELELGGDADSYAYWHSSQTTGAGLNFANYSSPLSDDALVTARVRANPRLRDAKYTTFAQTWVKDAPALSLYQPTLPYITARNVRSLGHHDHLPTPIDRFDTVNQWTVQSERVSKTP